MKLKTVDVNGTLYGVIVDGKPVFIDDDGKELPFDVPDMRTKIVHLGRENKTYREQAATLQEQVKVFEGIDPEAAKKALTTVKNLDDKKLVDAGEVERLKAEIIRGLEEKHAPVVKERDALKLSLDNEMIGGAFNRSKYIADKIALSADIVRKVFGDHFSITDGKVVAKNADGNPIYSRSRPGEVADFDEAIETLVTAYPRKDDFLKGARGPGSGAAPGGGVGGANGKTITRAEFTRLDPAAQMKAMTVDGMTVVDG